MRHAEFLVGFLLGLILLVSVGATYRFVLSEYQEECYEYDQIPVVKNWTWQDYNDYSCCLGYNLYCKCEIINKTYYYNSTINGDCKKYHLVRYAK
jgi:hypothetical protein